jgi:hypothetical protein
MHTEHAYRFETGITQSDDKIKDYMKQARDLDVNAL